MDNCVGTVLGGAANGLVSFAPKTLVSNCNFQNKAAVSGRGIWFLGGAGQTASISNCLAANFTNNIDAQNMTAVSIHACDAAGSIVTAGTGTVSNVGNY